MRFSNDSYTTELYFGIEIPVEEILSYSLPPKSPEGVFDVRFGWMETGKRLWRSRSNAYKQRLLLLLTILNLMLESTTTGFYHLRVLIIS